MAKTPSSEQRTPGFWQGTDDPTALLKVANPTERQARLFVCAGCQLVWNKIPEGVCKSGLDVSERFVDGLATMKELSKARWAIRSAHWSAEEGRTTGVSWNPPCAFVAWCATRKTIRSAAREAAQSLSWHSGSREIQKGVYQTIDLAAAERRVAQLIREIYGPQFPRP